MDIAHLTRTPIVNKTAEVKKLGTEFYDFGISTRPQTQIQSNMIERIIKEHPYFKDITDADINVLRNLNSKLSYNLIGNYYGYL